MSAILDFVLVRLRRLKRDSVQDAGLWGEQQAESFLKKKGWQIVGRRVRMGSRAEIDIVARDGSVVVFVEVKTRRTERYGSPASSVGPAKRWALSRAAVRYLKKVGWPRTAFRFDIVEVVGAPDGCPQKVRLIKNAFPLHPRYHGPC